MESLPFLFKLIPFFPTLHSLTQHRGIIQINSHSYYTEDPWRRTRSLHLKIETPTERSKARVILATDLFIHVDERPQRQQQPETLTLSVSLCVQGWVVRRYIRSASIVVVWSCTLEMISGEWQSGTVMLCTLGPSFVSHLISSLPSIAIGTHAAGYKHANDFEYFHIFRIQRHRTAHRDQIRSAGRRTIRQLGSKERILRVQRWATSEWCCLVKSSASVWEESYARKQTTRQSVSWTNWMTGSSLLTSEETSSMGRKIVLKKGFSVLPPLLPLTVGKKTISISIHRWECARVW